MRVEKRIVSVLVLVGILLAFSGVIAHLSPMVASTKEVAPPGEIASIMPASLTPTLVDQPYVIADIAEMAAQPLCLSQWNGPLLSRRPTRGLTQDPFNFFSTSGSAIPY